MSAEKLGEQFVEIDTLIRDSARSKRELSGWSVGQHLQHIVMACYGILKSLEKSEGDIPKPKFNFTKSLVFTTGKIPRGRAKSPKQVLPQDSPSEDSLRDLLKNCRTEFAKVDAIREGAWFEHPIFGPLTRRETLRFLVIHNNHHLKIVRDILG